MVHFLIGLAFQHHRTRAQRAVGFKPMCASVLAGLEMMAGVSRWQVGTGSILSSVLFAASKPTDPGVCVVFESVLR